MSSSLVKFVNTRKDDSGQQLSWGRAVEDGVPFRGTPQPYKEEEYEARTVRILDPKAQFFDVSKPDELKAYLTVVDRICNGWYRLLYIKRFWKRTTKHYVEWTEHYLEDGTAAMAASMEAPDGHAHFNGHSGPG